MGIQIHKCKKKEKRKYLETMFSIKVIMDSVNKIVE